MLRLWILAPVVLSALTACTADDPCLAAAMLERPSPDGNRTASIYPGGCPGVFLAPQVLVDFGGGGMGVFAVRDSAAAIDAKWLTNDTLEITYPPGVQVEKQDSIARFRDARVRVVYREASKATF
jgi:hypothetical protein